MADIAGALRRGADSREYEAHTSYPRHDDEVEPHKQFVTQARSDARLLRRLAEWMEESVVGPGTGTRAELIACRIAEAAPLLPDGATDADSRARLAGSD